MINSIEFGINGKPTYCWLIERGTLGHFIECEFNIAKDNPRGRALNCDGCRFYTDNTYPAIPSLEDIYRKNKLHRTIANNTAVKKDLLFKLHRVFDQLHALVEQAHDSVLQLPYNPSYGGNCNGKS